MGKGKGQVLLFVIVAITIALTVGLALTTRTISSLRRTSSSDTASRVFSAAEGGIEWFLRQPVSVLDALSDGDTDDGADCPSGTIQSDSNSAACVVIYEPQLGDNIQAKATVTVQSFSTNSNEAGNENYWFTINPGSVKEVTLKHFKTGEYNLGALDVCWKSLENTQSSGIYYLVYGADGIFEKKIITPSAIAPGSTYVVSGDGSASTGRLEYDSCFSVNIDENSEGIRIKSLYAP